jgi:RimJ/RimL family protein N-acetyltransferase
VTSRWWPLHDIRLYAGELTLAPLTEADLDAVATVLPADLEQNPSATRYDGLDDRANRGAVLHQEYWRSMGCWRPDAWEVYFVVRRDEEIVGLQGLEGPDFRTLRTVDTSSWVVPAARGHGIGKGMRLAVLALAFDHLGAQAAITSAWHDNHASLGVSRALGYRPNGASFLARGDGVDTLVHMRMTGADWLARGAGHDVRVDGLAPALPLFGLAP